MSVRVLVTIAATGVLLAGAGPALAEPDAGLHLTVDAAPSFVVGSQGVVDDFCGYPQPDVYSDAQAVLGFRATAPSGIAGYDARAIYAGQPDGSPQHLAHGPVAWQATNYDDGCGGGPLEQIGWRITAHDNAGHAVSVNRYYSFQLRRWNNRNADGLQGDTWAFSAGWARSACSCADGGSQDETRGRGRSASYLAHASAGEHLGLLMATGPGRGRADVYLDGTHVAIVDTLSATNSNRVYVWQSSALTAGDHVVRVVNQATTGRPRIDVNAMGALS